MTPSRSEFEYDPEIRQTGRQAGCLSGLLLTPLVVLMIGMLLIFAVIKHNPAGQSGSSLQNMMQADLQPVSLSVNASGLAPLFTPEVQFWAASIVHWSNQHGLDPNLAATIMQIESCGNPDAHSNAGATGLFQVMPFHFLPFENAFDPETNALRGLDYMTRSLQQSGGDARLALAGYNGGIGVISRSEAGWADEPVRYAYWGSGIYADAQNGAVSSERLNEWLAAGGASLCRSASLRLGLSR
jgi:soluble lytic murein transglycosylase-like protein